MYFKSHFFFQFRFVVNGTESIVNYTPMNELDYGTLLCWANNSIGIQDRPCVFHIVAAGKVLLLRCIIIEVKLLFSLFIY